MVVIQVSKAAPGGGQAGVIERRHRVSVEAGTGNQAGASEQPLLSCGEIPVGQVEGGGDRQVLRVHHGQSVPGRGQLGGHTRHGPGRMMPQLPGEHPDSQRQVPAQADQLAHLARARGKLCPAG